MDTSNIDVNKLEIVGRGVTSEVYRLDDEKVLKLFTRDYSKEAVDYEAGIAYEVQKLNVSAPKIYDTVTIGERHGIVYEYIKGVSLADEISNNRYSAKAIDIIVDELVRKQLEVGMVESSALPKQSTRFRLQLDKTHLDEETKGKMKAYLASLPEKNNVCHGDFHPGNVQRVGDRLVLLDWMNCHSGNIEGDLIRSILTMETPYLPTHGTEEEDSNFRSFKQYLAKLYKQTVLSKYDIGNYGAWLAIGAGLKLSDNLGEEEDWLKRMIKQNLKCLVV
ncbi:MAG TPA: aminoglycoside phosphotransferase family protein [Spirochaetales bacterium]|nr:aminoglycoside phosphotransferase family protein [Spirochaetales bacterium]